MHRVKLTLSDIITVLKLFPNMAKIMCDIVKLDDKLDAINYNNLPTELYSKYYPLSNPFRCLDICSLEYLNEVVAVSAILIAILCPRFTLLTYEGRYSHSSGAAAYVYVMCQHVVIDSTATVRVANSMGRARRDLDDYALKCDGTWINKVLHGLKLQETPGDRHFRQPGKLQLSVVNIKEVRRR
ncbi:hypothetical protein EDC05_003055 [Coemansia umbellata]|uniref:Uncharacterized protein n=1 Tax=Coemansia umbellata TaxID=1424467 RepID=A0ABQ8PMA6_9FUNG|nr:hypothetical protein EDC05_003055 [Coemansia umbellata]